MVAHLIRVVGRGVFSSKAALFVCKSVTNVAKKPTKRRFKKVPKTKKGTPKKYLAGAKNPKAREREIRRTAKLYREGKLTKAQMDKISKQRSKS